MPKLQALLQFLLMFCPKLIKGGLGLVQLGQEPGEGAVATLVWDCEAPLLAAPSRWRGRVGGPVCLPRARPRLRTVPGMPGAGPCVSPPHFRTVEGVLGSLRVPREPDLPLHGGERARATCLPASPLHGALTVQLVLVGALLWASRQRLANALQDAPPLDKRQLHILLWDVQARHTGRQTQTWPRVGALRGQKAPRQPPTAPPRTLCCPPARCPREGVLGGTGAVSGRGRVTGLPGSGQG